ncbi:M14 family metallocarboxypeptidase [Ruminococcaceae bacterium OttesenSCG-928-L11]|nr:M14 family metallocarboxypeptidase [Ruminococcaceae bacterium OttesenSCG-928-L11]
MLTDFYESLPDYAHMQAGIRRLGDQYAGLKIFPIGKSVLGRDITALSIGNPDNATLYVGATHGLEWLTSLILLRFLDVILHALQCDCCVSDINMRRALHRRSLVVVPCLNPDGVEIALHGPDSAGEQADFVRAICGERDSRLLWQANAHGVDINHNFDAGWDTLRQMETDSGIVRPSYTRYGGPHPHSEPETAAIATFCLTHQPRTLYALHSQGEEIYYHYGETTPTRSKMIAQVLAASSGYKIARPDGLASHGGLKDWYVRSFCRPGFTIEMGLGKNPLGLEQFRPIYSQIEEMLVLAALL